MKQNKWDDTNDKLDASEGQGQIPNGDRLQAGNGNGTGAQDQLANPASREINEC